MGQQLVSDCFPSIEGAKVGKGPPGAGGGSWATPPSMFLPWSSNAPSPSMFLLLCARARAIKYRQENQEAVGGFFSQIGELYVVHHLWGKQAPRHPCHPLGNPAVGAACVWGGLGASCVPSPQPTRTCSPGKRRGTRPGGRGAGMRMCTTRVSGTPCPHWGPPARSGDPLPSPRSPSFSSPADPDHGVTDNDSSEDLTPAVSGGLHQASACTRRGTLPACAPCLCPGPAGEGLGVSASP